MRRLGAVKCVGRCVAACICARGAMTEKKTYFLGARYQIGKAAGRSREAAMSCDGEPKPKQEAKLRHRMLVCRIVSCGKWFKKPQTSDNWDSRLKGCHVSRHHLHG